MIELASQDCQRKYANTDTVKLALQEQWLADLLQWQVITHDGIDMLQQDLHLSAYNKGLGLVSAIVKIAEEQQHHPEITLSYNRLRVTWWTHHCQGLHKNDFIMAAKTSKIFNTIG